MGSKRIALIRQRNREHLFEPLGMKDTFYSLPETLWERTVRPPPNGTLAPFSNPYLRKLQDGGAGVFSSPKDMAVFGQMFLNGGEYAGRRVLSRAAVREMTRNQIPGISAVFGDEVFPEACWGYGWAIEGSKKPSAASSLHSGATWDHSGVASLYVWMDPVYRILGVYFPVLSRDESGKVPNWRGDLFINMVTAALEDG